MMRRLLRAAFCGALLAAAGLARPAHAPAQAAAYGLVSGALAGTYVTTGIFVAETRMGDYLYSLRDALAPRWELLPAVAMPLGGLALGIADEERLASAVAWGTAGFAAGALVGTGLGIALGDTPEARWAGFAIGSAAGVLVGSIFGAASCSFCDDADPVGSAGGTSAVTIRIPL